MYRKDVNNAAKIREMSREQEDIAPEVIIKPYSCFTYRGLYQVARNSAVFKNIRGVVVDLDKESFENSLE